jgi:hypothetical protein
VLANRHLAKGFGLSSKLKKRVDVTTSFEACLKMFSFLLLFLQLWHFGRLPFAVEMSDDEVENNRNGRPLTLVNIIVIFVEAKR